MYRLLYTQKMVESKQETDFPELFLSLALIYLAALYVYTTNWTLNLDLIFFAVFIGFSLGFGLGKCKFDSPSVFWISLTFTIIFIFLAVSMVSTASPPLPDKLLWILLGAGTSIYEFSSGHEVSSPLILLISFTSLIWVVSLFGAYASTRRKSVVPILLIVACLFILVEFFLPESERNPWITGLAALTAVLLYIYRTNQSSYKGNNNFGRIEKRSPRFIFKPILLFSIFVLIIIAWSLPLAVRAATPGAPEAQRFNNFSYQLRDSFSRMTASLRGSSRAAAVGFGPSLSLGTKAASAETVIFTAEASQPLPVGESVYWRSKVYEVYNAGIWQEGVQKQVLLEPGEEIRQPSANPSDLAVTYRVRAESPLGDYFVPGSLTWINNPANLIFSPTEDGGRDVIAVEPENTVLSGNGYRLQVLLETAQAERISSSKSDIPQWVQSRYLQMPAELQLNIYPLALEITKAEDTDFDKALAVTEYLRSNYRYSEIVEAPTDFQDRIEWFLFEGKKGFCNYFASAEVLLLRSIGIPARLAVGFSEGELSADGLASTIREKNRHAWPEVFFPEIGWVIFEPTPSLPAIQFGTSKTDSETSLEGVVRNNIPNDQNQPGQQPPPGNSSRTEADAAEASSLPIGRKYDLFPTILFLIMFTALSAAFIFERADRKKKIEFLQRINSRFKKMGLGSILLTEKLIQRWQTPTIELVYNDIVNLGQILFGIDPGNLTPAEIIHALAKICPEIASEAEILLAEYQDSVFGGKITKDKEARSLGWVIQRKMIISKINHLFKYPYQPKSGE